MKACEVYLIAKSEKAKDKESCQLHRKCTAQLERKMVLKLVTEQVEKENCFLIYTVYIIYFIFYLKTTDSTGESSGTALFDGKKTEGSTEIRTRIVGFRVQSANHYTMEP